MQVGEGEVAGEFTGIDGAGSARRFLDMSIDLMGILDLDTTILEISQSWERTLGWTRAQVIGTRLLDYFHAQDLPLMEAELVELKAGGEAVAVVVRLRAADGTYRCFQGNARADLEAERIYVTAADITERKGLEDVLRRQLGLEELVATITAHLIAAEDAHVPAVIEQGMGDLARAMGADRAHFMRGRHQVTTTLIEWLHPEMGQQHELPAVGPRVEQWWRDVLRSGRVLRLEDVEELEDEAPDVLGALRADGVRSVLLVPLPPHRGYWGFLALVAIRETVGFSDNATALLRLAGEVFLTALARGDDAAALLDARRELEHRNEELERSNEELERFAYAAAHDLKAPLGRIEMALAATASPGGDAVRLIEVARRGTSRMRQLIEDLLTFASVGNRSGAAGEVDRDDLLAEVLADFGPAIEDSGAEIAVGELPRVWGHRTLLGQVLQNLVGNSLKFMRPGVTPVLEVSGTAEDGGVAIRVADNGIGVRTADRGQVFGVFTRLNADDEFPGSGIGLATCAKVVSHHGGRVWLEDGIDGGITVVVWLPDRPGDG